MRRERQRQGEKGERERKREEERERGGWRDREMEGERPTKLDTEGRDQMLRRASEECLMLWKRGPWQKESQQKTHREEERREKRGGRETREGRRAWHPR